MKTNKWMILTLVCCLLLAGCVDQKQKSSEGSSIQRSEAKNPRIVATSMATVYIMEKLDMDLVGVCDSQVDTLPERYETLPKIGMAMTPDIEKIKSLDVDYVFSPVTLISDLLPKYEAADLDYGFLNLSNIPGMYKSIEDLGTLLDRKEEAAALVAEYREFMEAYRKSHADQKEIRVLILMGLPGSYVVATENAYVGSLVKLAGATNVYAGSDEQFLTINTEDMLQKDPDIILRTAHAMPEDVMAMFREEFQTNDIWKHFRAVKEGRVYDLDYKKFGMSAKFNYKEALEDLAEVFHGEK